MPSSTRLPALGCCLLLVTAGCSSPVGSPGPEFQPVSADQFVVQNADDEPHTLHVAVVENGSVVYLDSFRLNGTYEGPKGTTIRSVRIEPNPMAEPGNYTVGLRVDDGDTESRWLARSGIHFSSCEADESPILELRADDDLGAQVLTSC